MTLSHKTRFNTSGQGFRKRPYSLSMLSLQKTSKAFTKSWVYAEQLIIVDAY